jgi:hypothetical protein
MADPTCHYCHRPMITDPPLPGHVRPHCPSPTCDWCTTCWRAACARAQKSS